MSALSDQVLAITRPYLGPATDKFMTRQCAHLKIDVPALEQSHLEELAKWVNVSGKLIMDPSKALELAKKIANL